MMLSFKKKKKKDTPPSDQRREERPAGEVELPPHMKRQQAKTRKAKIPTKVMFLQEVWYPLQGVMNLSASLKLAGHRAEAAIGSDEEILKEIRRFRPQIVALSSMTSYREFMLRITRKIKEKKYPCLTVVGGFDSSFFPEIIEQVKEIDVLCRGEGNEAMVELADCVAEGKDYSPIKNLWVRKDGKIIKNGLAPFTDIDDKPMDDHEIYRSKYQYFKDIEFMQIMAGRGCPYRCSYCFNHKYREMYQPVSQKYTCLREPGIVIDEIDYLKKKYGYKTVFFNDSTLGYDKKWLLEFCRRYQEKKINLPFTINMCANEVDEEIAKALGETKNCFLVRVGLEHGNEWFRKTVLRKMVTDRQLAEATNWLGENGIPVSYQFMIGLPGETFELAEETLKMAVKISRKDTVYAVNIFKPFPKMDLTQYGLDLGQYDSKEIGCEEVAAAIGTRESTLHDCFRRDSEGQKIVKLARLAHLYLHFPVLRPLITKILVNLPDNFLYKKIWYYTDVYYTSRHHINASFGYLLKFTLKYFFKPVR